MNIEENITKKTDLENNDSLSQFINFAAQQNHSSYRIFYDFIKKIEPKRILEIGTALGGFTQFLAMTVENLNLETKILSYDVYSRPWYNELLERGIDVRVENIFSNDYTKVDEFVINFIKSEGITVVLCDGGNKIGEFNILSKYLKSGDFILAHDYSFDKETYSKEIYGKIWNWCEITEEDITPTCLENNLTSYEPETFSKCVWVCKQKNL